jgi:hypothetical protein
VFQQDLGDSGKSIATSLETNLGGIEGRGEDFDSPKAHLSILPVADLGILSTNLTSPASFCRRSLLKTPKPEPEVWSRAAKPEALESEAA